MLALELLRMVNITLFHPGQILGNIYVLGEVGREVL